jgi:putative ABC transport system permease protein
VNLVTRLMHALEGVAIALDSMRANKARAALTILGVAIGVFVVVALSSVVRGINESFARDVEAAGPTSFFVYRRPISGFNACDGSDDSCPERRNPPITNDEGIGIGRLPSIYAVTQHIAGGSSFKYHDRQLNAGVEYYSSNWTDVDGGDIDPGRSFTYTEDQTGARVVIINDKLADAEGRLFEGMTGDRLHPTLKGYQIWADALKPLFTELLGPAGKEDHAPPPTGDPSARK